MIDNIYGDLIYYGDWYFDFYKMAAYRGGDYRNHNIRTADARVDIQFVDEVIVAKHWSSEGYIRLFGDGHMNKHIFALCKNWLDDQIEKIVL